MKFFVTLQNLIYTTDLECSKEIIGDLPVVSDNHKLLAKFHSGTLKFMLLF